MAAASACQCRGIASACDIVLAIVSDEEAGGDYGAKFRWNSTQNYSGLKYAIGEFGGFTLTIGGSVLPHHDLGEAVCWMTATVCARATRLHAGQIIGVSRQSYHVSLKALTRTTCLFVTACKNDGRRHVFALGGVQGLSLGS